MVAVLGVALLLLVTFTQMPEVEAVLKRIADRGGRRLKVKAMFKGRGSTRAWYKNPLNVAKITRKVRSQRLTNLALAGQWPKDPPWPGEERPHLMRAMLVANIDVPNGFANGASGRIVHWGPEHAAIGLRSKGYLANVPGVQVRFVPEAALASQKAIFGLFGHFW